MLFKGKDQKSSKAKIQKRITQDLKTWQGRQEAGVWGNESNLQGSEGGNVKYRKGRKQREDR